MKFKHLLITTLVIGGFLLGINALNDDAGSGSKLEKDLAESLPAALTTCYFIDNSGEIKTNQLTVKQLTVNRQSTDGNYKSADCTVRLEGRDLSMTAYVNLSCIRYDDGKWAVQSYSKLSEPALTPGFSPSEPSFQQYIQQNLGIHSLSKTSEYISPEKSEVVYHYDVDEYYGYFFTVGNVTCRAVFEKSDMNYSIGATDTDVYCWQMYLENNTRIEWDVLGIWHMEYDDGSGMPRKVDYNLCSMDGENAGTSSYAYQTVQWMGSDSFKTSQYTGKYKVLEGGLRCTISGDAPDNAMCVITGYQSEIVITAQGVTGMMDERNCKVTREIK